MTPPKITRREGPSGAVGPCSVQAGAARCRSSQCTRRKLASLFILRTRCMIGDLGPVAEERELGALEFNPESTGLQRA